MKISSGLDHWPKWGFGFKVWDAHGIIAIELTLWKSSLWLEIKP